jgi:hypothetical protein
MSKETAQHDGVIPPHEEELDDITEEESEQYMEETGKTAILMFMLAIFVPPASPFFIVAGIISGMGAFSFTAKNAEAKQYNEYREKVIDDQKEVS